MGDTSTTNGSEVRTTKYFKEFKPVLSVSRSTLRKGQASLYDLVVAKLKDGEPITFEEAHKIWFTQVCRNMRNGVPHRTQYGYWEDGEWHGNARDIPMTDLDIKFAVLDWLTRNLGLLVMRGYLKAIPMVNLV